MLSRAEQLAKNCPATQIDWTPSPLGLTVYLEISGRQQGRATKSSLQENIEGESCRSERVGRGEGSELV